MASDNIFSGLKVVDLATTSLVSRIGHIRQRSRFC
jgi:hypothetical protein